MGLASGSPMQLDGTGEDICGTGIVRRVASTGVNSERESWPFVSLSRKSLSGGLL